MMKIIPTGVISYLPRGPALTQKKIYLIGDTAHHLKPPRVEAHNLNSDNKSCSESYPGDKCR